MTTTEQLTETLADLQNVLKVIQNDPTPVMPEKHHVRLKAAIFDCLIAIDVTKQLIKDSEEDTNQKKALFDAGLSTAAQMDFKYHLCKDTYEELLDYMFIHEENKDYKTEIENQYKEFYSNIATDDKLQEIGDTIKPVQNSWRKNILNKVESFLPKLKTYLSASKTIVNSLAKVYDIPEKLSEVLGFIDVGISMMQPIVKAANKKKE